MKELSIEQKAKAYDEAFNVALETYQKQPMYRDWLEKMFPELKESEDEKIRKELMQNLKERFGTNGTMGGILDMPRVLSWLEKQGEPVEINPTEFDTRLQALIGKFNSLPKEELIGSLNFWLNVVQNDGTYKDEKSKCKQKLVEKYNITDIGSKNAQGKLGEMIKSLKSANKIEPKFRIGDKTMSKAEEVAMEHCCVKCVHDKLDCSMKLLSHGRDCIKCGNYIRGYQQAEKDFLDNIWHSPNEEPEIERKIIWESENFLGKHLDREWKPKIDCFGREERWCYLADILPSKNWTGERPYSKVDYSRGYDNGYEQAEKDLANAMDETIKEVCEWLYNHNDYICGGTNGITMYDMGKLIEDLKKYLENKL